VIAVPGLVYDTNNADPVSEQPPLEVRKSTPCDDKRAREKLEKLQKNPDLYNAVANNCRLFARGFHGYGMDGWGGKKQEPCRNPDGTLWEEPK